MEKSNKRIPINSETCYLGCGHRLFSSKLYAFIYGKFSFKIIFALHQYIKNLHLSLEYVLLKNLLKFEISYWKLKKNLIIREFLLTNLPTFEIIYWK